MSTSRTSTSFRTTQASALGAFSCVHACARLLPSVAITDRGLLRPVPWSCPSVGRGRAWREARARGPWVAPLGGHRQLTRPGPLRVVSSVGCACEGEGRQDTPGQGGLSCMSSWAELLVPLVPPGWQLMAKLPHPQRLLRLLPEVTWPPEGG